MDPIQSTLQARFGHPSFRPGQRPVVEAILAGRSVVGVMPTGTGKSLCYQLPAVLLDGVALVVSPLIALMKDQVDALTEQGVAAAFLNSTQTYEAQRAVLDRARRGDLDLLYVAPERFRFGGAMAAIRQLPLSLFVVDEAHCISQWGHDFRPDYLALGRVAQELGVPRVAAFTATATERVRGDIAASLMLSDPLMQVTGFLRENLHLSVVHVRKMQQKTDHIVRTLRDLEGGTAVVYCATRKNTEKVASQLRSRGFDAREYHGGLGDEARSEAQEAFAASDDMIMVATNAFGMGVDKANVRLVAHYDVPGSLEAYYQEAGRAGRDGAPARCVLFFSYADTRYHEFFIDNGGQDLPPDRRAARAEHERQRLRQMVRYAYEGGCRHSVIVRYFGESLVIGPEGCGACDVCTGTSGVPGLKVLPGEVARGSQGGRGARRRDTSEPTEPAVQRDMTEKEEIIAQKVLSAVARSQGRLGVQQLARVLRGSKSAEILTDPLAGTRSYGLLSELKVNELTRFLKALGRAGCTRGMRPSLSVLGVEVMHRRRSVRLDLADELEPPRKPRASASAEPPPELDDAGQAMLERLREARLEAARERKVPAYTIASNKLLARLADERPSDYEAWLAVKGIGERNVEPLRELFGPLISD